MADFNPQNASIAHLEFTSINQAVNVVNTRLDEYRVQSATYRTSNGVSFPDLKIICNDTNRWSYSSLFKYSVNRKCYYSMFPEPDYKVTKHSVNNIPLLPEEYDVLYRVDNPEPSMNIHFDLIGLQRHAHETTDPDTGTSTITWGEWYEWSQTYTITIETNLERHCALIEEASKNGKYAKLAPEP